jgi:PilZ domain-containing protein
MPRLGPERRRTPRFRLELRVEWDHHTGLTRDVSASGMFFVTQGALSLGDPIELTLVFERLDRNHPLRLHCRGQVVRVDPDDGTWGIAVAITAYHLL